VRSVRIRPGRPGAADRISRWTLRDCRNGHPCDGTHSGASLGASHSMMGATLHAAPGFRWRPAFDGRVAVLWAILLLLGGAVLLPLIFLFRASTTPAGLLPFESPVYTWRSYVDALFNSGIENLVANTLIYAAGSTAAGISVATCLAWLVERTDIPFRTTIRLLRFA